MNKSIFTPLLLAAMTLPMSAVAEIKIIGQAQLEVVNTSGDSVKEGLSMDDGSEAAIPGQGGASMLGVTGAHDLDDNLSALYKINFSIQADDDGGFADRDQFIGLKGNFGTLLMGRMNTPYKSSTVKWDPFLATFMQARGSNGMSNLHNGYADNVIAYANKINEARIVLALNIDETNDNDGDNNGDHGIHGSINTALSDSFDLAAAFMRASGDDAGTAIKIGVKWRGDDLSAVAQFETLNEDIGDQNNLYLNLVKQLGQGASAAIALGSQADKSSANNDGTYLALGYNKMINEYASWHGGIVFMDEGDIPAGENASQLGAGVRLQF